MPIETLTDEPSLPLAQEAVPTPPPERPGFIRGAVENAVGALRTGTASGTLAFSTLPNIVSNVLVPHDPFFDPYRLGTEDFFRQHPYMVKPFSNGTVDDIPNDAVFWNFVDRQRQEYDVRQRMGKAGGVAQFVGGAVPVAAELFLGGAAADAAGAGEALAAAGEWARSGGTLAKAIKGSIAGAGVNVAYDQVQHALNQNRSIDEVHSLEWSAGMGAAFGAMIPFLGAAKNRAMAAAGDVASSARIQRLQRDVGETMASKPVADIMEVAKQEREALRAAIKSTPAAKSSPEPFSAPIETVPGGQQNGAQQLVSGVPIPHQDQPTAPASKPNSLTWEYKPDTGELVMTNPAEAPSPGAETIPPRGFGDVKAQGPAVHPSDAEMMLRLAQDTAGKDASRPFTILDDGTPETAKLIADAKAKGFDIQEHPLQQLYDLQREVDALQPVELGLIGKAATKVFGIVAPEGRLTVSPSILARKATRLMFDVGLPTREQGAAPITTESAIPAESLRAQYHGWFDEFTAKANQAMRDGIRTGENGRKGFTYTFADGSTKRIRSVALDKDTFGYAVVDYMRRLSEHTRAGEGEPPTAPKAIKDAAAAVQEYTGRMAADLKDTGLIDGEAALDPLYLTRRYIADAIESNTGDFKARLVEQQRLNAVRDFKTGKPIAPQDQPVNPEVVNHDRAGRVDGKGLTKGERETITALSEDGDLSHLTLQNIKEVLGPETAARYLEEQDIYFHRRAEAMTRTLLDPANTHGVEGAMTTPSPLKNRIVQMDETRFAPYLDQNLWDILGTYNHKMSGRLAARAAIKSAESDWAAAVKEATGKDLAAEGYNPQLVLDAIKADFQKWIDETGKAGDVKAQELFKTAKDRTVGLLENKISQLEGRPLIPNNPSASVGWGGALMRFGSKQLLRLPLMAFLGKSAIANATDAAALSFYSRMTPQHLGTVAEAVNFLRDVPQRRNLEGVYVAASDLARTIQDIEIGDIPGDVGRQPFGPGRLGRVLAAADTGIDAVQNAFTSATGIRRVNTNLKRAAATLVQQDVFEAAKQIARAKELIDAGVPEADAIAQVGLEPWRAQAMARMGINGSRAQRLLKILDEHAVDLEGNKLGAGWREHDGWISPEMKDWHAQDRDLYRALNHAVNSEVLNLIVEPKLLSRPAIASTWTGRALNMFQNFTFAWGNQLVQLAAQRPAFQTARYIALSMGMSAVADAAYGKLTGKRDLDTTAQLWRDKPYAMIYAAVNRSPLLGWLQRPIGTLESLGVGPAQAMGVELTSMYGKRDANVGDLLGPAFGWANNLYNGTVRSLRDPGYWDQKGSRQLWNALPFHNIWQLELLNRTAEDLGYDTPIGPEPRPSIITP